MVGIVPPAVSTGSGGLVAPTPSSFVVSFRARQPPVESRKAVLCPCGARSDALPGVPRSGLVARRLSHPDPRGRHPGESPRRGRRGGGRTVDMRELWIPRRGLGDAQRAPERRARRRARVARPCGLGEPWFTWRSPSSRSPSRPGSPSPALRRKADQQVGQVARLERFGEERIAPGVQGFGTFRGQDAGAHHDDALPIA